MEEKIQKLEDYIRSIPNRTPAELYGLIKAKGYVGQEKPLKALCLMAFRHIRRLKKIYVDKIDPDILPKKQNSLLIGPTGCGKTFLIELLFKDLLGIPTAIIDITNYSETGYVGQDITSILTRLIYAADYNPRLASIGIICLDEFDKISSGQNSAIFAGAGTTKDVTGLGIQRELLKMLESTQIPVPTELSHNTYQNYLLIPTRDIAFISAGAFSGFKLISKNDDSSMIGFSSTLTMKDLTKVAVSYSDEEVDNISNFQKYGFLPELIARFNRIIPFDALSKDELKIILDENVIKKYKEDFLLDNIDFNIKNNLIDKIINNAIKRQTGARGLEAALTQCIESSSFDIYSKPNAKKLVIGLKNGKIHSTIT